MIYHSSESEDSVVNYINFVSTSLVRVATVFVLLITESSEIKYGMVSFYQTTRRNIPEDSRFHTRRRENLKSRQQFLRFPKIASRIS
jgi:hypothetical protein